MNSIIMPKTVKLNEETIKQLEQDVIEVKETIASPSGAKTRNQYTAVEMWNHQRNTRSAADRIRRWNLN